MSSPARNLDPLRASAAASRVLHEVLREGIPTGRRFNSLVAAQRYAATVGGEVRAVR